MRANKGRTATTRPEKVATVLDAAMSATLGMTSHHEAAERAGIEWHSYHRLKAKYAGVVATLAPTKSLTLELGFGDIAHRAQAAITDEKLEELNGYQLALVAAIATDKRAILRGEPSAIIGHTHEAAGSLDRLCEAIVGERERRMALPVVVSAERNDM